MKKWIVYCICMFFICPAFAQRANYELAEKSKKNALPFGYDRVFPVFVPDGDNFWFKMQTRDGEKYYYADVKAKKVEDLFDAEYIAVESKKVTGGTYDPNNLNFWGTPFKKDGITLVWQDEDFMFEYNRKTKKLTSSKLDFSAQEQDATMPSDMKKMVRQDGGGSPDGKFQVFGRRYNLYLRDLQDSTETQLTFDGEPKFSYTRETDDDRETREVVVWSPDSKRFYHYRHDIRDVEEIAVMNYLKGRPSAWQAQVVLAGDKGVAHLEVSLFDVQQKKQIKVNIGKWKDQMSRIVYTSDDLQKFYMERKKRTCDVLEICQVDVNTGDVKVLIHEESKPFIGVELNSIRFLNDCKDIIMWSERTGYGHLYHYDGEGNLKNAITAGDWTAGNIVRIDEAKREIYFQAYGYTKGENPSYAKICKANIDGKGKITLLTPEEATHTVEFSPSGRYFVDSYSRPDMAPRFTVRDIRGNLILKLGEVDISSLSEKGWKMPETFSVKAADGKTDLYGVMWKPFDFDPNKKYPIISNVYPGPQDDGVPLTFEYKSLNEGLAQVGFVVVVFNHRGGIPYRGREYHSFGYGNIRDYALADDKRGLEQLVERYSFVDGERIGVYGHSGGGFMSAAAICTYTDFYKAAVSSSGNHDNTLYSNYFVEMHHGIKEVIKDVRIREKTSSGKDTTVIRRDTTFELNVPKNMELAKNLKGHLMLVVGGQDGNVPPASTFRMVNAFVNSGKDIEFVYLPEASHFYKGVSDWYYQHKLWSHFAKYLLGDFTTPCFGEVEIYETPTKGGNIIII